MLVRRQTAHHISRLRLPQPQYLQRTFFGLTLLVLTAPVVRGDLLEADDECRDESCALNALQLHSQRARELNASHPPLCDPSIVAETCEGINKLTSEYYGTTADKDLEVIHAAELSEHIMASRSSVLDFFNQYLGLENQEDDKRALARDAVAVKCMDLCEKLVASIPKERRPPASDVACYMPDGASKPLCDIDVSASAFEGVEFSLSANSSAQTLGEAPGQLPETGDGKEVSALKELLHAPEKANRSDQLEALDALNYPALKPGEMTVVVCNLFRIYPLNNIVASASPSSTASFLEGARRSEWIDDVTKLAVKAQAYTATAIRSITSAKADATMMLWFGDKSTTSKKEVRRVSTQVNRLLSNVAYEYPGPQCRENVYAYVHPNPPYNKNDRGQYLFYLCDDYIKAPMGTQLETLTHEASHHETSLTDDVCYKGSGSDCLKAYGRVACQDLAKSDSKKALRNADNFCFFVNDIQPNAVTPSCPELPRCSFDPTCSCSGGLVKREEQTSTGSVCYTCGKTPSKKPLKKHAHGSTSGVCPSDDTGGTCRIFLCSRTRGPTMCSSGKCFCRPGLCAEDGYCVPPKVMSSDLGSGPDQECQVDTGGTCKFLWCWHGRGPTNCIDGKCQCREGYCQKDGTCEPKLQN
ncbi:unnamed protein product [Durusdinium trenchii]|uniref:Lysine-specific metallo-endopeptidase domain-containing protein n=2 Tax=Durusdinium trenchii TaxID=1381693 RepID=A0ABP0H9S3_9DINO